MNGFNRIHRKQINGESVRISTPDNVEVPDVLVSEPLLEF